jgi:hypothetical protein
MPARKMNPPVLLGSSAIIAALLILGIAVPGQAEDLFSVIQSWIIDTFGWLYILSVGEFVFAVLFPALSRYGRLKLGPDEVRAGPWLSLLGLSLLGLSLLDRHAVCRRDGHRADVLRGGQTDPALFGTARNRPEDPGSGPSGHGHHLLPLGYPYLGDLRNGSRGNDTLGLLGFTQDQVIADVPTQYERCRSLVHSSATALHIASPDPA